MTIASTTDLLAEGLALHRSGNIAEAAARYEAIMRADPGNADAPYYLGLIYCQQRRFSEGAQFARKSLANHSRFARAHVLLGRALSALGRPEEALASLQEAIDLAPGLAEAHGHRGDALCELGRNAEAIESYDRSLSLAPDVIEDWFNRGVALFAVGRGEDALLNFDRVVTDRPDFTAAVLWRAKVLCKFRRHAEALTTIDSLLTKDPEFAAAWVGRGNVLSEQRRTEEAFASFDKALELQPNSAEAWVGRANLFSHLQQDDKAFAAYQRALTLKQNLGEAWLGRGNLLIKNRRYEEAFEAFDAAFELNAELPALAGLRIHAKQHLCDWTDLEADVLKLLAGLQAGKAASVPFALLATQSSAADQLQCAKCYIQDLPAVPASWSGEIYSHDRIRLAYLSADFREHPVSYLAAGLFEHHDRTRFETTAISVGADRDSPMRKRIEKAFEHFIDVDRRSDEDVAKLIGRLEIDILVDLMGFTLQNRLGVLARRPAPIQINYLGYSGTMGADCFDYILADSTVIPEEHCQFYSEQVVWLPDCYLVNDDRRVIAERVPGRRECGLPEDGFVFCCFNNPYKFAPETFRVWMRLLTAVPGAVLWLSEPNATAADNLRREAQRCGVPAERIIFASRTPDPADHLARLRQADLFLDTLPYNAHTTACDALWAGLPLLTCLGSTFAGRVAASLLKAVGLDELIAHSLEEYEALALRLARDSAYLSSLRARLARNRATFPLFATARTTRNIEAAYAMMWERHRRGELPKPRSGQEKPIQIA